MRRGGCGVRACERGVCLQGCDKDKFECLLINWCSAYICHDECSLVESERLPLLLHDRTQKQKQAVRSRMGRQ